MLDINFLAFCITAIAIIAIVFGKEDIAGQAIAILGDISKRFTSIFDKSIKQQYKIDSNIQCGKKNR